MGGKFNFCKNVHAGAFMFSREIYGFAFLYRFSQDFYRGVGMPIQVLPRENQRTQGQNVVPGKLENFVENFFPTYCFKIKITSLDSQKYVASNNTD